MIKLDRPLNANPEPADTSPSSTTATTTTTTTTDDDNNKKKNDPLREADNDVAAPPPPPVRNPKRHSHRRSLAMTSMDPAILTKEMEAKETESASSFQRDEGRRLSLPVTAFTTPEQQPPTTTSSGSVSDGEPSPKGGQQQQQAISSTDASDSPATERPSTPDRYAHHTATAKTFQMPPPPPPPVVRDDDDDLNVRPRTADASFMLKEIETESDVSRKSSTIRPVSTSVLRHPLRVSSADLLREYTLAGSDEDPPPRPSTAGGYSDVSIGDHRRSGGGGGASSTGGQKLDASKSSSRKKPKRVRSWAGSLLTRSKSRKKDHSGPTTTTMTREDDGSRKSASTPNTPAAPMITRTDSDAGSGLDVDFDDDSVVVLQSEPDNNNNNNNSSNIPEYSSGSSDVKVSSFDTSWKPKSFYEQSEQQQIISGNANKPTSAIDLDAALGPFNSPEIIPAARTGFSIASRRMYSGGRRGEFVGPEMRYHRRTESAPEIAPAHATRGSPRGARFPGIVSTVDPDVLYEEEEEDAFSPSGGQSPKAGSPKAGSPKPGHRRSLSINAKLASNADNSNDSEATTTTTTTTTTPTTDTTREPAADEKDEEEGEEQKVSHQEAKGSVSSSSDEIENGPTKTFPAVHDIIASKGNTLPPSPLTPAATATFDDYSPSLMPVDRRRNGSTPDLSRNTSELSLAAVAGGSIPPEASFTSLPNTACETTRSASSTVDCQSYLPNVSTNDVVLDPSVDSSVTSTPPKTNIYANRKGNEDNDKKKRKKKKLTKRHAEHGHSPSFLPRMSVGPPPPPSPPLHPPPSSSSSSWAAPFHAIPRSNRRGSGQSLGSSSKRSSIASLSKLVGYRAEKSKLSYEEKPPDDDGVDKESMMEKKVKKGRRVSRIVQFWKKDSNKAKSGGGENLSKG